MKRDIGIALLSLGIDPRQLRHLRNLPRYLRDRQSFSAAGGTITHGFPILNDFGDQAGSARGHYFHQDLLVASFINDAKPRRHIDVGSRIDGFVAHVASFRPIDVLDVRDLADTGHPNIRFVKQDLMQPSDEMQGISDSVSCLHAIEHFGLGRYSDPIDPEGHKLGFRNIWRMVEPGGRLYMGFPIGRQNEVHFNAHRVFHPRDMFTWADDLNPDMLERFDFVDDAGRLHTSVDLFAADIDVVHGCGIYTLRRPG